MSWRPQKRERTTHLILRLAPDEKERWTAYVKKAGGYLSVLARRAIEEYIDRHPKPEKESSFQAQHFYK